VTHLRPAAALAALLAAAPAAAQAPTGLPVGPRGTAGAGGGGDITAVGGCLTGDCYPSIAAHLVYAAPDGAAGPPGFRALVLADLPALSFTVLDGLIAAAQVPAAAVTQHEAALAIGWVQLTGVPATFPPAAHAGDHETGGADPLADLAGEVITSGTVPAAHLGLMVGDSGAGGARGAVPAPAAGDAAAGKYFDADGTWTVPPDTIGDDDQTAQDVPITDAGAFFAGDDVEAALQEVGPTMDDARPPTGPAGGALGGSYPDPTVDDDGHEHGSGTATVNVGEADGDPTGEAGTIRLDGCTVAIAAGVATITCAAGGGGSFAELTSGTNTSAAMVVGTGSSLKSSSTGTIDASAIDRDGDGAREVSASASSIDFSVGGSGAADWRMELQGVRPKLTCSGATNGACYIEFNNNSFVYFRETGGAARWQMGEDDFGPFNTGGLLLREAPSSTNPTVAPDRADADTGIGTSTAGGVALIDEETTVLTADSPGVVSWTPLASAPASCGQGDTYTDTSGAFCACTSPNTWTNTTGVGSCA